MAEVDISLNNLANHAQAHQYAVTQGLQMYHEWQSAVWTQFFPSSACMAESIAEMVFISEVSHSNTSIIMIVNMSLTQTSLPAEW